jgi:hypothetical protein
MDYKNKYLKYKNKYLDLKNIIGGRFTEAGVEKTAIQKLDELTGNRDFTKYEYIIDDRNYGILVHFFKYIKETQYTNFLPDDISEFIGKLNFIESDLNKIWSRYVSTPTPRGNARLQNPIYKYGRSTPDVLINSFIDYNHSNGVVKYKETPIDQLSAERSNLLDNFKIIVDKILAYINFPKDDSQVSGLLDVDDFTYFNIIQFYKEESNEIITIEEILHKFKLFMIDRFNGEIPLEKTIGEYNCLYFERSNIFIMYKKDATDDIKYRMYYIQKLSDNDYKIFPLNYNNLLINEKYENSLKQLFKTISQQLNTIHNNTNYQNIPDKFFHIHITPVNEENYVLLTLHALYEITTTNFNNMEYTYVDKSGISIPNIRKSQQNINENIQNERSVHSFYILFNLNENRHYLYKPNGITRNENGVFWGSAQGTGILQTNFGNAIADINHVDGYGVILTRPISKCMYFCN